MLHFRSIYHWHVDVMGESAVCGPVAIGYRRRDDNGIDITHWSGLPDDVAARCFIVGKAIEAIRRKITNG